MRLSIFIISGLLAIFIIPQSASAQNSAEHQDNNLTVPLGSNMVRSNHCILHTRDFIADMVKIDFNAKGFEQLSLAGNPLLQTDIYGRLRYMGLDGDETDEEKRSGVGTVLMWTGAVLGGLVIVGTLGSCIDGVPKEEKLLDFCPFN